MRSEIDRSSAHFDYILLGLMYVLMVLGVLFISVATFNPEISAEAPLLNKIINSSTGRWQAIFTLASPVVVWFMVSIPYEKFKTYARFFYYGVVLLLLIVMGASSIRNVRAWFSLALNRMLQPSEFAKIAIILMVARHISSVQKPLNTFKDTLKLLMIIGLPAGVTFLQGEAGSVIVMAAIFYIMLVFGGADWKWLVGIAFLGVIAVVTFFGYAIISESTDYRVLRILSFIDPKKYAQSAGLQILSSQEAIGSGGLTGIGLFVIGSHSQLNYVPEDWTDFVFATVGEAVGFVGSALILILFLLLILRMLYLARYTYDRFGQMIIIGVMAMIFFHVFQNIAMTIGLMPITGIPLPFISYGGSNLMTNVIGISLVLNVTKNRTSAVSTYVSPMLLTTTKIRRKKKGKIYVYLQSFRRKTRSKNQEK